MHAHWIAESLCANIQLLEHVDADGEHVDACSRDKYMGVRAQVKNMADLPAEEWECHHVDMTAAWSDNGMGAGCAWNKKDRKAMAKCALALSASQRLSKDEMATKLQWLEQTGEAEAAAVRTVFAALLEKWSATHAKAERDAAHSAWTQPTWNLCGAQDPPESMRQRCTSPAEGGQQRTAAAWSPCLTQESRDQAQQPTQDVWVPTAFDITNRLDQVEKRLAYCQKAFLALGEVVCADRYIMMQAYVVDGEFRRAPLEMKSEFAFPHMTFVKLEGGEALQRYGELFWKSTITNEEINITGMLAKLNHSNKSSGLAFKLVPVHIQRPWQPWLTRYEITGGEGRQVFRRLQAVILSHCHKMGEGSVQ
ncbi:ATP7A, partial [Symbiodinium sp. CCMP2456]